MSSQPIPKSVLDRYGIELQSTIYSSPETGRSLHRVIRHDVQGAYALKAFEADTFDDRQIRHEITVLNRLPFGLAPRCHGQSDFKGARFLLLDWIEGRPLGDYYRRSPRGPSEVKLRLQLLCDLAFKLDDIHRHRVIHRDLKPDNVLVVGSGGRVRRVHIIDFGLSAQNRAHVEGTPIYQAPEQNGERHMRLTQAVDVFALGQMGWFLLSASPCHLKPNFEYSDWAEQDRPDGVAGLPEKILEVLDKAVSFSPDCRQRSAGSFAGEIRKAMRLIR